MTFLRMSLSAAMVFVSVSGYASNTTREDNLRLNQVVSSSVPENCTPTLKDGKTEFELGLYDDIQSRAYQGYQQHHTLQLFKTKLKQNDRMFSILKKNPEHQNCVDEFNLPKSHSSPKKTLYCFKFSNSACTRKEIRRLKVGGKYILFPACSTCDLQQGLLKGAYGEKDSPPYKIIQSTVTLNKLLGELQQPGNQTVAKVDEILKVMKSNKRQVENLKEYSFTKKWLSSFYMSALEVMKHTRNYIQNKQPSAQVKD